LLPDWEWEALEKEEDGLYYGRVKSPNTYGKWEYGYFSQEQLEKAGAYRTDTEIGEDVEPYPDGGRLLSEVYETELDALIDEYGDREEVE
jgi:hypothetical protein